MKVTQVYGFSTEEIEALIYPADSLFERLQFTREESQKDDDKNAAVVKVLTKIVDKINKNLQPYQRITKVTVLEKPLEMTTTLKVKRNYK